MVVVGMYCGGGPLVDGRESKFDNRHIILDSDKYYYYYKCIYDTRSFLCELRHRHGVQPFVFLSGIVSKIVAGRTYTGTSLGRFESSISISTTGGLDINDTRIGMQWTWYIATRLHGDDDAQGGIVGEWNTHEIYWIGTLEWIGLYELQVSLLF